MKKILLILGSFMVFGVASAQTDSTRVPTKKPVKTEKQVPKLKKDKSPSDSTDYDKNRGRTNPKDITEPKKVPDTPKQPKSTKNPTGSPDTPPKTPME